MSEFEHARNSTSHLFAHTRCFLFWIGVIFVDLSLVNICGSSMIYMLSIPFLVFSFFWKMYSLWKNCKCGLALDLSENSQILKVIFFLLFPSILIALLSLIFLYLSGNILSLSLIGFWLLLFSATGISERILITAKISDLNVQSLEKIDKMVTTLVLLGDLESAEIASKILIEKAIYSNSQNITASKSKETEELH